jgi:hypothetical protein
MVDTIKFSQMTNAGDINNNDIMPSLRSAENVILNNPWTFLPPGTTAQRPTPSSTVNYRLRFNTDNQLYEYYDAVLGAWTQLQESAFTVGPFVTYTADPSIPDAQNLGLLSNGILKQTISLGVATLDIAAPGTDYWAPGDALTRTQVPLVGDDVTNKTYVDSMVGGAVTSVEGTANQVLVNGTSGSPQTGALVLTLPQDIGTTSDVLFKTLNASDSVAAGLVAGNASNYLISYSPTASLGLLRLSCADNAGNFIGTITNLSLSASRTWSWPDATGTISLTSDLTAYLPLAGGTMSGDINLNNAQRVTDALDPVQPQDYATKRYVDQNALNGTSVYAASAGSLGTVTQAGAGIGATLTNAGTQATFALDGVNPPVGTNVLIKDTATGMTSANEGIYTVTDAGSGATDWVLTRATTYDTPSEINNTGLILIQNGSTLAGTAWYNTTTIATVDTTAFNYLQFGNIILPLSLANGGTNASLTASNGGIFYSTATAGAILAGTNAAGRMLQSGNLTTPSWSTTTYPATNAINTIMYASSANVLGVITPVNSAVLISSSGGVPSFSTTLPSGLTIPSPIINQINDANGNEMLVFTAAASAVNYIEILNSSTGNPVRIKASGDDASIQIGFYPKGGQIIYSDYTGTNSAKTYWYNAATTHYTSLTVASAQAANLELTLPGADGSAGTALVTNGSGVLSFSASKPITRVIKQLFTGNGTYTPTSGMTYCIIEAVGGGGAGGGATSSAGQSGGGGGGGSGGYARLIATAATIGASQTVTIGAGGTAGTAGNNPGNNGGDTSVGTLCIGKGGTGGNGTAGGNGAAGGAGGVAGTGDITFQGQFGWDGQGGTIITYPAVGGHGGNSMFGTGGRGVSAVANVTGQAAVIYGGGGGGGISLNAAGAVQGGVGTAGVVFITEFVSA